MNLVAYFIGPLYMTSIYRFAWL